jgi:hypothetical protein
MPIADKGRSPSASRRGVCCDARWGLSCCGFEPESGNELLGQFEETVNFLNGLLNVQTDCVPFGNEAMSPALSSTCSPVARSIITVPSRTQNDSPPGNKNSSRPGAPIRQMYASCSLP